MADDWAGFGKPPGPENTGTGGFTLPPGAAGLAAEEPAGAEPVEFGATVGIIPVVEGGTGVPGVGN